MSHRGEDETLTMSASNLLRRLSNGSKRDNTMTVGYNSVIGTRNYVAEAEDYNEFACSNPMLEPQRSNRLSFAESFKSGRSKSIGSDSACGGNEPKSIGVDTSSEVASLIMYVKELCKKNEELCRRNEELLIIITAVDTPVEIEENIVETIKRPRIVSSGSVRSASSMNLTAPRSQYYAHEIDESLYNAKVVPPVENDLDLL